MTDIVERLRDTVTMLAVTPMNLSLEDWDRHANAIQDAAALITRLRAEMEKVREVLADTDTLSLPNDYPTERMAQDRMRTLKARTLEGLGLIGKIEALTDTIDKLRAALRPFAARTNSEDYIKSGPPDGWCAAISYQVKRYRDARAAMETSNDPH